MYSIDIVIYISVQSTSSIKLGLPLRSDQDGGEGVGRNPPLIVKGFFKILVGGGGGRGSESFPLASGFQGHELSILVNMPQGEKFLRFP